MNNINVEFTDIKDKDLVFLDGFLLCTINYDGDFEIDSVRDNIRKILIDAHKTK